MLARQVQCTEKVSRFREPDKSGNNGPPGHDEALPVRRQLLKQAIREQGNANLPLLELVGSKENVVELQKLLGVTKPSLLEASESKLMQHIAKVKFPANETRSCQESHPGLYMWLSKTSPIPSTVVTKMRPGGWKATKKAKESAEYASNKQRRERIVRLKVVGGRDLARAPKSVPNSGQELDRRSALAVNASYFSNMFQRLMSLQYHVEYDCAIQSEWNTPNSYDSGNGESFLPAIACEKSVDDDLQVINELQEEFRKIALQEHNKGREEAVQRGYGTQYTMSTAGDRFLAENTDVTVESSSYEATRYRIEGDKANVHLAEFLRYESVLEKMLVLNGKMRPSVTVNTKYENFILERVNEIKAIAHNRWKALGNVPPLSRKQHKHLVAASKREMKQNRLDTTCLIDNSNKVLEITGSPLTSPDNTLCVAAKYQIWLWKHNPVNQSLHADRYEGAFSKGGDADKIEFMFQRRIKHVLPNRYHANAMKVKYGLEDSDMKVPAIRGVQSDKPVQRSDYVHESDYVMAVRRNKVVTSITLEVDTPWKSVQGTYSLPSQHSSLEAANDAGRSAANDPNIPVLTERVYLAQEVCIAGNPAVGPTMPDEVSEMRNRKRRTICNLSVFKKGGMSRARARIASIEEAKYRVSLFNANDNDSIVIYMPPVKEEVINTVHDNEWSDNFVKEFIK